MRLSSKVWPVSGCWIVKAGCGNAGLGGARYGKGTSVQWWRLLRMSGLGAAWCGKARFGKAGSGKARSGKGSFRAMVAVP